MATRDGAQELVVLFDPTGSKIDLEMRYGQFNGLLAQRATLASHAASTVKAAYAQVGAGLSVQAVVFYLFKVNEEGCVDPAFNLPLDYMADNAGEGPDLGSGAIKMACRSQCPVPWHGINMWEPDPKAANHPAMLVQKAVWRNRLGLKPVPVVRKAVRTVAPMEEQVRERRRLAHDQVQARAHAQARSQTHAQAQGQAHAQGQSQAHGSVRFQGTVNGNVGVGQVRAMEEKLTATFGEAGRVSVAQYTTQHREQVGRMADQFRSEMNRQQQGYLEQIKGCRDEIQKLKAALRHEQERNRRLQQLLRGDV